MTDRPSERSTKAQILKAYDQLMVERDALEAEVKQLQQKLKKQTSMAAIPTGGKERPEAEAGDKMTATIDTLGQLQSGFGGAVSELSEQLTSKSAQLQALQAAVVAERQQLQDLHDLEDIEANTLDTLIQTYTDDAQAFELEMSQSRARVEQELQDLTQAWEKEQEEHRRAIKERDQAERKSGEREAEEYEYNLTLQRSLDQAQYEQTQENLYRQLANTKQVQEKEWADREAAIAQREQQFEQLQTQVETFEQNKAEAIAAAVATATETATYETTVKADLRHKELDGQRQVYELRIQSLEQTIQNQEEQMQNLSKQLNAALKQVQDLAVKAIEGSANVQSYQAFKEIAMEQAKTPLKGK